MKLRTKLLVISLALTIIPTLLSFCFSYSWMRTNINRQALMAGQNATENMSHIINSIFNSAYQTTLYSITNKQIQAYLQVEETKENNDLQEKDALGLLSYINQTNTAVHSISVFRLSGEGVTTSSSIALLTADDIRRANELRGMFFWNIETETRYHGYPYICRQIRNPDNIRQALGFVKVYILPIAIRTALNNSSEYSGEAINVLVDSKGNPVFYSTPDRPFETFDTTGMLNRTEKVLLNGNSYYASVRSVDHSDYTLISFIKESSFFANRQWLFLLLGIMLVVSAVCSVVTIGVISHMISQPLKRYGDMLKTVGRGSFDQRLTVHGKDELSVLGQQINLMIAELQHLYQEVYQNRVALTEARIYTLRSQINPHFLYNTLDTIYWISEANHTPQISQMIMALSDLFKTSLHPVENSRWPFPIEYRHMQCYLDIQKTRFQESLTIDLNVQEGLDGYKVLPLILQPIVENAITHGAQQNENGLVRISIFTDDRDLIYEIWDNGESDRELINDLLAGRAAPEKRHGLALVNINERLKLSYGDDYPLRYEKRSGGSLFTVKQPMQPERNDKDEKADDR